MTDQLPETFPNPGQVIPNDPFGRVKEAKQKTTPPPEQVNALHTRSDLDSSQLAQHHSLGIKHDQASPGDHTHNGQNSKQLLENFVITGDRSDGTALVSVINALVQLGATDSTVA